MICVLYQQQGLLMSWTFHNKSKYEVLNDQKPFAWGVEGGGMVNQGPWIYIGPVFMTPWDVWGFGYLSPTEALEKLILPLPQWFVYTQLNIWISVEVVTQFLQSGFDQISHHRKMRYIIRWRCEIYSAPPEIGWW